MSWWQTFQDKVTEMEKANWYGDKIRTTEDHPALGRTKGDVNSNMAGVNGLYQQYNEGK